MNTALADGSPVAGVCNGSRAPFPPGGELSIDTIAKKEISPMGAILRSRHHLSHQSSIPGSPTDKLMSPTSRKLRKNSKTLVDDKYGLQETKERLSFSEDDPAASLATAESNIVLGSASVTKRIILEQRGWVFTVLESNCDFEASVGKSTDSPLHVAKTIAHALSPHFEDSEKPVILITVSQVYKFGDTVRHPPADEAEAVDLLLAISGQTVTVQIAVVATICPGGQQVNETTEVVASFQSISKDMATRLVKRNFTVNTKNLPIKDVELKLRCRIDSGTEDAVLGMPITTCENVLKNVLDVAPKNVQDQFVDQVVPLPPSQGMP